MAVAVQRLAPASAAQTIGAREAAGYTAAMYLVRGTAMAKSVILAALLGPHGYGAVTLFITTLGYLTYLDVGAFHAQNREVPMAQRDDRRRADEVVATAWGVTLAAASVASGVALMVAVLQILSAVPGNPSVWAALAIAVLTQQAAGFHHSLCSALKRFQLQATVLGVITAVDFGVSVVSGVMFGARGVIWVTAVATGLQFLLLRRALPKLAPRFDLKKTLELARIGLPIEAVWLANMNLIALDKVVIVAAFGTTSVGLYTLAGASGALLAIAPQAVAALLAPRLLTAMASPGRAGSAFKAVAHSITLAALTAGAVLPASLVALPFMTALLLPHYEDAITAGQVLLVASAILAASTPLATFLNGLSKQTVVLRWYVTAAVANIAIDGAFIGLGWGITAIAVGSLLSYSALVIVLCLIASRESAGRASHLAAPFAPLLVSAALGVAIEAALVASGKDRSIWALGIAGLTFVVSAMVVWPRARGASRTLTEALTA